MIYSGLEFGQYFELERDTKCHNVLLALTPATRMAFIFIQMYFIFLNNEVCKFLANDVDDYDVFNEIVVVCVDWFVIPFVLWLKRNLVSI
jgi:Otopetrin